MLLLMAPVFAEERSVRVFKPAIGLLFLFLSEPITAQPVSDAVEKVSVEEISKQLSFAERCHEAAVGKSVYGTRRLVEYVRGDSMLILAAPHGGRISVESYPERSSSSGVLRADANTDRLVKSIQAALAVKQRQVPHMIICHLQRKYMDANRPLDVACERDSPARQVWHDYQQAIDVAKSLVREKYGRGLFVEVHGHGHPRPRLELGYLLRARDYDLPSGELRKLSPQCSLREIAERGHTDLENLLRGASSLGAFLAEVGVAAVPSPQQPRPGKEPYFNGGWNTRQHGSRDGDTISSVQIEFPKPGMRDSTASIESTAPKIASALQAFLESHYPVVEKR